MGSLSAKPTNNNNKKERKKMKHSWVQSSHTSAHCTWCGQEYPGGDSSCVPSGEGKGRYENFILYKEKNNIEDEIRMAINRRLQPCGGVSVKISGDISKLQSSKNTIIEKIIEIFPYGEGEISGEKFVISYDSFPGGGSSYPGFRFEISLL